VKRFDLILILNHFENGDLIAILNHIFGKWFDLILNNISDNFWIPCLFDDSFIKNIIILNLTLVPDAQREKSLDSKLKPVSGVLCPNLIQKRSRHTTEAAAERAWEMRTGYWTLDTGDWSARCSLLSLVPGRFRQNHVRAILILWILQKGIGLDSESNLDYLGQTRAKTVKASEKMWHANYV
jgi:hypothetical protein